MLTTYIDLIPCEMGKETTVALSITDIAKNTTLAHHIEIGKPLSQITEKDLIAALRGCLDAMESKLDGAGSL